MENSIFTLNLATAMALPKQPDIHSQTPVLLAGNGMMD
jgi:hypothetical protein